MGKVNLFKLISNNKFFQDLEKGYIEILEENSSIFELEPDYFIFTARDEAKYFYLILEGQVSIQLFSPDKGSISIEQINNSELLGWSWLKPPYQWHFDALTLTKTRLIRFDAKKIMKKMNENKSFGFFYPKHLFKNNN